MEAAARHVLITDPVAIFIYFSGILGVLFYLKDVKLFAKFFKYFPPLIWCYFLPMVGTSLGITPASSPLYKFMSNVVLPATLVLLLVPADIKAVTRLGGKAIIVMLIGTLGIVLGAIVGFALFHNELPQKAWTAIAALSGSWIGGSMNMIAVAETLKTPPQLIGPIVVVDTVLAYSWLGILIALSAYQVQIDRWNRADDSVVREVNQRLSQRYDARRRPMTVRDFAFMTGLAFVVSRLCLVLGGPIDYSIRHWVDIAHAHHIAVPRFDQVLNAYGWGILLITAVALVLSLTKLRDIEDAGATSVGYVGLYLLLASMGAQADVTTIGPYIHFFFVGLVWLAIHIVVLFAGMKLLRAPLFMFATGSMANIGGTASAPVVAATYHASMAPVGLLMAILGYVIGTPTALFLVAMATRAIAGG